MIKAVIFDLDNCIFDTSSMGEGVIDSVFEPLMRSVLPQEIKAGAREALRTDPLNAVIERFSIPKEVADAMRAAYCEMVLPPERNALTYGDEDVIATLPVKKILVTTGYKKFQQSKIERLGISALFDEIIIDELDDLSSIRGKKKIFEEILARNGLSKGEVLVVGDNPRSELQAAKELGIIAVQTLRPRIAAWDLADHRIESLRELAALIK